ncbi:MAG TPA: hypothetical protein VD758_01235, partial [Gemmatimonadaceae bacterium]|nr:hypothetical protein [Gemmatimonadaceae bacterium]
EPQQGRALREPSLSVFVKKNKERCLAERSGLSPTELADPLPIREIRGRSLLVSEVTHFVIPPNKICDNQQPKMLLKTLASDTENRLLFRPEEIPNWDHLSAVLRRSYVAGKEGGQKDRQQRET